MDEAKFFEELEAQGFVWMTPLHLHADEVWDEFGDNVPQVDEPCPKCRNITDRTVNYTRKHEGVVWGLEHCVECNHTWFTVERD